MRAIAEFIMRGRVQATLVVVISAALPLLFWLSAAASCLVLLRRGPRDAIGILAWAILPALVWWYFGDPRILLVLLSSMGLALMLRAGHSWVRVLLVSMAVGLVFSVVLGAVFREPIAEIAAQLQKLMPQMLDGAYQQLSVDERGRLESLITPVLTGLMAALLQIVSLLCLMLGRYWQALLYNPGGFGREFQALRLPPMLAFGLLTAMLIGPNFGAELAMLTPLCSVPLAFAGMALMHGLGLPRFWLVGLYVLMLLQLQLVYPLLVALAIVDSLIDFRGRRAPKNDAGSTNGEG
ncbi:hypothetical protein [Pseudomonas sp. Marseille-Q8238]